MKRPIKATIFIVVLIFFSTFLKLALLKNIPTTILKNAPELYSAITPSLASGNLSVNAAPSANFKILQTNYFDNNNWVLISVASNSGNEAFLLLEKVNGVYTVVLGPGTIFSSSIKSSIPSSMSSYMIKKGLI